MSDERTDPKEELEWTTIALAAARTDAASARDDLLDCQRKLALVEKERDIYREWLDDIAAKINTRPL